MTDKSYDRLNDFDPDIIFSDPLNDSDPSSTSKYFSIQDFKHINVNKSTTLSIVYLNVRSFGANFDKFQALFKSFKFVSDVLILSETWFTHES